MHSTYLFTCLIITGVKALSMREAIVQGAKKETLEKLHNQLQDWNGSLTPLQVAVSVNNYEACEYFIYAGVDLNASDEFGASALFYAVSNNNLRIVNLLLENDADVNHADLNGMVSLHIAAKHGFLEICKALVLNSKKRIKADAKDKYYRNVYHYAAKAGHNEVIEFMTSTDAIRNGRDKEMNMTPLQMAIVEGHTHVALSMYMVVIDPLQKKCAEELRLAAQYGRTSVLIALLDGICKLEERDAEGNTVLLNAVSIPKKASVDEYLADCNQSADVVRVLITMGADLQAVNFCRKTAANLALERENYAAYSIISKEIAIQSSLDEAKYILPSLHYEILSKKTDVNSLKEMLNPEIIDVTDHLNRTAAHLFVAKDNLEIVQELIYAGCDLSLKDSIGNTVLHLAKNEKMAKIIVRANPQLTEVRNEVGNFPLHSAITKQRVDVVKILAPLTKDIGAPNFRNYDPVTMAISFENYSIIEILLKYGAKKKLNPEKCSVLHIAALRGMAKMTKFLLEKGFETTARYQYGNLPAHCAAFTGKTDIIRLLMKGVDPNATDLFGQTFLHYAAKFNRQEAVEVLLKEFKASPNLRSHNGNTPLIEAVMRKYGGIVKILISYGADVTMATPFGDTPLYCAVNYGSVAALSFLAHADRGAIKSKRIENGMTPIELLFKGTVIDGTKKNLIVAMELTVADIPDGQLKSALGFFTKSFVQFITELREPIDFKDYVKRGMEEFKKNIRLGEHLTLERNVEEGLGIFYAFAAAYYPELASSEVPETGTQRFALKQKEYRNSVLSFEEEKNKTLYMKKLRYLMMESFVNIVEASKCFVGTYMNFVNQEIIDDMLIGVTNNGDVWGRMELLANSLMLSLKSRGELALHMDFLNVKMARLAEIVIPGSFKNIC